MILLGLPGVGKTHLAIASSESQSEFSSWIGGRAVTTNRLSIHERKMARKPAQRPGPRLARAGRQRGAPGLDTIGDEVPVDAQAPDGVVTLGHQDRSAENEPPVLIERVLRVGIRPLGAVVPASGLVHEPLVDGVGHRLPRVVEEGRQGFGVRVDAAHLEVSQPLPERRFSDLHQVFDIHSAVGPVRALGQLLDEFVAVLEISRELVRWDVSIAARRDVAAQMAELVPLIPQIGSRLRAARALALVCHLRLRNDGSTMDW